MQRDCRKCHAEWEIGDPDPCWGRLLGVQHACCGHGGPGYFMLDNGVIVRFRGGLSNESRRRYHALALAGQFDRLPRHVWFQVPLGKSLVKNGDRYEVVETR